MIVSAAFRTAYKRELDRYERLQAACDPLLKRVADEYGGMFDSRVKSEESLYSKAETGKFHHPFRQIVDFYAATIAIPTIAGIPEVTWIPHVLHWIGARRWNGRK